ncbi:MAG: FkbM family methyltransferase [Minisyncoccota bacterium]
MKPIHLEELETLHRVIEMDIVEDYRVAIDAGANVGVWSNLMSVHFGRVIAFEPNPDTFNILMENVGGLGNVDMHCQAVMDRAGSVRVFAPKPGKVSTGWQVEADEAGGGHGVSIDDFELDFCGLIKIDIEGAELLALRGADRTIRRCRPVLIVEFAGMSSRFGYTDRGVHGHILGSGYREVFRAGVDRVFVPK